MTDQELHDAARRLVANEVHYCVSGLISAALQNFEAATALGIGEDDLYTLASRRADADDYADAAPEGFIVMQVPDEEHEGEGAGRWEWMGPNSDEVYTDDGGEYFDTEVEAWRSAFETNNLDEPDGREVYEHWLISDWLADKLEERGESVVRDVLGLTIWGRTTSGQMIAADSIIEAIARDLHA